MYTDIHRYTQIYTDIRFCDAFGVPWGLLGGSLGAPVGTIGVSGSALGDPLGRLRVLLGFLGVLLNGPLPRGFTF